MSLVDQVLTAGRAYLGWPYGIPPGPGQIDCSLLVLRACQDAGAPYPAGIRTAEQIRLASTLVATKTLAQGVDWTQARPGDLLLFEQTGGENPGERAGHIGFLTGDGVTLEAIAPRVLEHGLSPWHHGHLFEIRRPPQYATVADDPAPAPADDRLATAGTYVATLAAPDGEIVPALQTIHASLDDASVYLDDPPLRRLADDLDAVLSRLGALWTEWHGDGA